MKMLILVFLSEQYSILGFAVLHAMHVQYNTVNPAQVAIQGQSCLHLFNSVLVHGLCTGDLLLVMFGNLLANSCYYYFYSLSVSKLYLFSFVVLFLTKIFFCVCS